MSAPGELLASRWDVPIDLVQWIGAGIKIAFMSLPDWAKYTLLGLIGLLVAGDLVNRLVKRRRAVLVSGSDDLGVR